MLKYSKQNGGKRIGTQAQNSTTQFISDRLSTLYSLCTLRGSRNPILLRVPKRQEQQIPSSLVLYVFHKPRLAKYVFHKPRLAKESGLREKIHRIVELG